MVLKTRIIFFNLKFNSVWLVLTVNSILYRTGNLRRCSHNLMKNFNSVGVSGIVCDNGLFSSEILEKYTIKRRKMRNKVQAHP
jgi:hypothetical protein